MKGGGSNSHFQTNIYLFGNKCAINKQHLPNNWIPLHSIPVHSAGIIRHRNGKNSRPSCQISFHWNLVDSAGMTGFLQELGGHCKDQYFLMPYRFLQECFNSTGFRWIAEELMHSCRNRTGIQIFLSLYCVIF
jgi:hypothetical protein